MRALSTAAFDALCSGGMVARDFVWFTVRNRDTGAPYSEGYWTDVGLVDAEVINPDTGAVVVRQFRGAGTLISSDPIPLISNLTVRSIDLSLSQVHDRINELIRGFDPKQGRVEIFRGVFDPTSRLLVAPATPRFVGFIDAVKIRTPPEGEVGSVTVTCKSHSQELTRSNPATRSSADQRRRHGTDSIFKDASVAGQVEIFWGEHKKVG